MTLEPTSREILQQLYLVKSEELTRHNYAVNNFKEIDYGIQFTASKGGWSGTIRIYRNKKGIIKFDYSQIKVGLQKDTLIGIIETSSVYQESLTSESFGGHKDHSFIPVIGTDESGKGDYFGPLVAAGVYVNDNTKTVLESSGVRDSKKINDAKILELAALIKRVCNNQYAIIEISPETYNNLYESFQKESKNLNTLLAWAHAKAIEEVLGKVECDNVLSDKFADEKFILSKLQERGKKVKLRQEHKAESNIAVAAASILARARFLEGLRKLSEEYGFVFSKGVSTNVIEEARKLVKQKGKEELRKVAKLHFKTSDQIIQNGEL